MRASLISPKVLPEGSRQGAAREIRSPECVKVRFHTHQPPHVGFFSPRSSSGGWEAYRTAASTVS